MAINPETQYPGKIDAASADYPHGRARNVTNPSDGTGTPLEKAWLNDLFGFQQALLSEAGITPSGAPDTARNSQYLDAMRALFLAVDSDIVARITALEEKVYEDISINQLLWVEQHFNTPAEVAAWKGYGTWERALKGRVAVGFSDLVADPADFKTYGATYGAATHTLTAAQLPVITGEFMTIQRRSYTSTGPFTTRLDGSATISGGAGGWDHDFVELNIGGGLAHNNVQPSKTLDCWKRIA